MLLLVVYQRNRLVVLLNTINPDTQYDRHSINTPRRL